MDKKAKCIEVIDKEIAALEQLRKCVDDNFSRAVDLLNNCTGKVIITGVGKSGHIARKIAATMASLGTMAFFLHPDDALHGDLGMVGSQDVVIGISNSGESDELLRLIPGIKTIGAKLIAITYNAESTLAVNSDILCQIPKVEEACILGMAPTSSTTVTLTLGDALSVVLSELHQLKENEYAVYHPAGALGKRLTTKVMDVMRAGEKNAVISSTALVKEAISEIGKKELGAVLVSDSNNCLLGLITEGDLRRGMEQGIDIYNTFANSIMTKNPITINQNELAVKALEVMKHSGKKCFVLPVVDNNNKICGILSMSDILRLGIVY